MNLPLKAHVKNGKLVLEDAATNLPEGSEVELYLVDGEFAPGELEQLNQMLDESDEDIAKGDHVDAVQFADELLAKREAASR